MPFSKRYVKKRNYFKNVNKRPRFSKKKFTKYKKSSSTVVRPLTNSKQLYVKLRWTQIQTSTIAAGSFGSNAFNCTSCAPLSLAPGIPVGSEFYSGIPEYSDFYDNYTPLGTSISIRILNNRTIETFYRAVLVPVSTSLGDMPTHRTILDGYDYSDLAGLPGAQTRVLGLGTGGAAMASFKMFRKTKGMIAVKDIRDNEILKQDLPVGTSGGFCTTAENTSWFYYLKIFNSNATQATTIETEVKLKTYFMLSGRKTITQAVST